MFQRQEFMEPSATTSIIRNHFRKGVSWVSSILPQFVPTVIHYRRKGAGHASWWGIQLLVVGVASVAVVWGAFQHSEKGSCGVQEWMVRLCEVQKRALDSWKCMEMIGNACLGLWVLVLWPEYRWEMGRLSHCPLGVWQFGWVSNAQWASALDCLWFFLWVCLI